MILNTILCIIITSLFVNGLQIATAEGMILHPLKSLLDRLFIKEYKITLTPTIDKRSYIEEKAKLPQPQVSKAYYPILYCIKCMPSLYGSIICLLFMPVNIHLLYLIPVVIICSSALATILHSQYI